MTNSPAPRLDDPELERLMDSLELASVKVSCESDNIQRMELDNKRHATRTALRARVAQLVSEAREEGRKDAWGVGI